ncbi:MAG: DUF366 family protein [Deltaproteobacteria bacterium]|nr:DUF366 family protein [Deltaproteobacteria bacterium]
MQSKFLDQEISYDGSQLVSHWILRNGGLRGDAIVSFVGPCRVGLDSMVDLEDVIQKKAIFSESMLHFIIEHFDADLEKTILRQRLLVSQIQQELADLKVAVVRKGNDLYLDHYKLNVSIATASPVSTLIHAGINIISRNTPVPTKGLQDFDLNPQAFARSVMNRYLEEMEGIRWARCKVRSVL